MEVIPIDANRVSTVSASGSLTKYDTNRDGRLDSAEIAAITLETEVTKSRRGAGQLNPNP